MLFDSAPLFIPTRWNAAQEIFEVRHAAARGHFPDFEPEIDLLTTLKSSGLPVPAKVPVVDPIDLLASSYWDFFEGFGSSDTPVAQFPDSQSVVVVSVAGGESLPLQIEANGFEAPPLANPVICFMRVDSVACERGAPILGRSSGSDSFDRAVMSWLKLPDVVAQLPIGYLEVTVYP